MRNRQRQREQEKQRKLLPIGSYMKRAKTVIEIPDPIGYGAIRRLDRSTWLTQTRTNIRRTNKMKRENVIASVALDSEMKNNLEKVAKIKKTSLSKLFKNAVVFYLGLSDGFRDAVVELADGLGVLPTFVIERLALAHWAEMAAEEEIAGQSISKIWMEFAPGQTSLQFYETWKDNKVRQAQQDQQLADHMTELNKYKLPGEQAVYPSELQRRKDLAELIKQFPDKAAMFKKADARQREYEAKAGNKHPPK